MNRFPFHIRAAVASTALFAGVSLAPAQSPGPASDEVRALREQIAALDQKLRILERKQELKDETATAAVATTPVIAAGAGGFSIASADKKYQLRIRGNIQADGRLYLSDGSADNFRMRRVRPSFEGVIAKDFNFRIMPDFAGSTLTLVDAFVGYQFSPALNIQAGKFKVPFDLERLVSQTDLPFIERSYTAGLSPNRDNGIHLFGDVLEGRLTYNLAWVNGTSDGESSIVDDDSDKEAVVRLFAHPFKGSGSLLEQFGAGIAVTNGNKAGGVPAPYRTNAQQTAYSWRTGVLSNGTQTRIEPQAYFYHGPFGLLGAWTSSEHVVSLGTNTSELKHTGWFVTGSWLLTGENATYRSVNPAKDFSPSSRTWGAWEVLLRLSGLDVDDAAFPIFANPATSATEVSSISVGVNWYLNRNVKASVNYEHSEFTGGESGAITGQDEDAIFSRLQLRF